MGMTTFANDRKMVLHYHLGSLLCNELFLACTHFVGGISPSPLLLSEATPWLQGKNCVTLANTFFKQLTFCQNLLLLQ